MANTVLNDALWEKLSEIEERIDKGFKEWNAPAPSSKQADVTPEIKESKEKIIEIIKKCIQGLGSHCDMHFKSILEKSSKLNKTSDDVMLLLIHLVKESQKPKESENAKSFFNFKFFKIRKTSVVIAVMSILIFTLTVFSMKQQNDYTLLTNEYYRQAIELRKMQSGIDSIKVVNPVFKKKK